MSRFRNQNPAPPSNSQPQQAPPEQERPKGSPPVWKRRLTGPGGQLEIAIFERHVENNGQSFTTYDIALHRSYYDQKSKSWKEAKGFKADDMPQIVIGIGRLFAAC